MAFLVAFYSYKGGVGRTLALANVGYSLAARGKRVVLIDMDLEAPGLDRFPELGYPHKKNPLGFLDYAARYRETGKCPKIDRYVHQCEKVDGDGTLWRMPSGKRGESYQEHLGHLPWRRLHDHLGTPPFVDTLREALVEEFDPHYVLIDSRTGLSDIGGLSTHLFADAIVLVTNLTVECIEGSAEACRAFLHPDTRPQQVHLVASPVPPVASDGESLVDQRLDLVREKMPEAVSFGRDVLRVEYDPQMALSSALAVRHPRRLQAAARYEELREQIQRSNPEEVFPVVEEARRLRSKGRMEAGLDLLRRFAEDHPDNAEGFLEWGSFLLEVGRRDEAIEAFRRGVEVAPELASVHRRLGEALYNWGFALARLAEELEEDPGARRDLLLQACRRYEQAIEHTPDDRETLHGRASALLKLAELAEDPDDEKALLAEAETLSLRASEIEA